MHAFSHWGGGISVQAPHGDDWVGAIAGQHTQANGWFPSPSSLKPEPLAVQDKSGPDSGSAACHSQPTQEQAGDSALNIAHEPRSPASAMQAEQTVRNAVPGPAKGGPPP